MYYYIFESSRDNEKINKLEEKIRDYVSDLGIAGEMSSPTHARSLEYLISQAIEKKYSTIIAVGGIKHITEIASYIAGLNTVLGIIPTDHFPDLESLLNIKDWQEAADCLKPRRYLTMRLGVIDPGNIIFLTSCKIEIKKPNTGSIKFPKYVVENIEGNITVIIDSSGTNLAFNLKTIPKKSLFNIISFKAPKNDLSTSIFKSPKGQITSKTPSPLFIDGIEITQTPVSISMHPKKLKLIVAKKQ